MFWIILAFGTQSTYSQAQFSHCKEILPDVKILSDSRYTGIYEGALISQGTSGSGTIFQILPANNEFVPEKEGLLILTNEHVIRSAFNTIEIKLIGRCHSDP